MYKKKKIFALIPARKGSIGIKNKNIKELGRKKLIEWTLSFVKKVKLFDHILISSDCKTIKKINENKYKYDFIKRSRLLSTSKASAVDVVLNSLEYLENKKMYFDYIVYLEPTTPFRTIETVTNSLKKCLSDDSINSFFVVKPSKEVVGVLDEKKFIPKYNHKVRRRQERNNLFKETGVVYITKVKYIKKYKKILCPQPSVNISCGYETLDINDDVDFMLAEKLIEKNEVAFI